MKITVDEERYFPTLGVLAQAGDTVDVPDGTSPVQGDVKSAKKAPKDETVVNDDGSAA